MRAEFAVLAVLCIFVSAIDIVAASSETSPADSLEILEDALEADPTSPIAASPDSSAPKGALGYMADEDMKRALGKAVYESEIWTMERNARIYAWQDFSTKLIFWTVLVLVFVGVLFSGVQFFSGRRGGGGGSEAQVSHVELSTQGVKVSSPFLGLVLLVVSLGFFYLYLVYVYPISLTK